MVSSKLHSKSLDVVYVVLLMGIVSVTIIPVGGCDSNAGTQAKDVINVREINVCDEDGNVRFRVAATKSGAVLTFLSSNSQRTLRIVSDDKGAALGIYDGTGIPRVVIAGGKERSEVILFDSQGQPRNTIGTSPQDTGVTIDDNE